MTLEKYVRKFSVMKRIKTANDIGVGFQLGALIVPIGIILIVPKTVYGLKPIGSMRK
jgi:hypothetical protein